MVSSALSIQKSIQPKVNVQLVICLLPSSYSISPSLVEEIPLKRNHWISQFELVVEVSKGVNKTNLTTHLRSEVFAYFR